jgi:hypothetical protein
MKVFNVGDVLAAADVNEYLVNTKFAFKPADTPRTSNTTLTADPDLTLAVDASKTYLLETVVNFYNGGGTTGNIQYSFSLPASAHLYGGTWGRDGTTGDTASASYDQAAQAFPALGAATWSAAVFDQPILIHAVLVTGASAGSITLNWAQDASSGTATTVREGSFMFLRRVA